MPDIVNDDDLSALAAEYVLGTLEADERTRANVLLDVDHGFRGLVRVWERRLGELHLMVEAVAPDARIWERIRSKLGAVAPSAAPSVALEPVAAPIPAPAVEEADTPERKLADLIMEVEKFSETRPPAPSHADPFGPGMIEAAPAEPAKVDEFDKIDAFDKIVQADERGGELGARDMPIPVAVEEAPTVEPLLPPKPAGVGGWRICAVLMTLVALTLGGLIAAWRFIPERLPMQLRPIAFLNIPEAPTPEIKKPPPAPGFDE